MNHSAPAPQPRTRLLHLITGLGVGGAEQMLYRLLSRIDRSRFEVEVGSLLPPGDFGKKIDDLGVPVWTLGMRRGFPDPLKLIGLRRRLRRFSPDLVQTWMYHADLMGSLSLLRAGNTALVWGIHNGSLDRGSNSYSSLLTARMCAGISGWIPDGILYCSEYSRKTHREIGYRGRTERVIPNGFDVDLFRPDAEARAAVRGELGLAEHDVVIGLVARYDPVKDHATFLKAAGSLVRRYKRARFLLCGRDVERGNPDLIRLVEETNTGKHVRLLGERPDIPRLMAAVDIAANSSRGEAFPQVVGEAMSCGVPCVVTDAGDSALLVGDTGLVVPPGDPERLAGALARMIDLGAEGRQRLGTGARERVLHDYRLERIVELYQDFYRSILDGQ